MIIALASADFEATTVYSFSPLIFNSLPVALSTALYFNGYLRPVNEFDP